jgi:hypothetical protein
MGAMDDDEIERPPVDPRREVERKLAVLEAKVRELAQRHGRLAAGIALSAVAAFGIGIIVYRRRQRKSLLWRVQNSIPDSVFDLPEELVAQLKKPLQRAAKAL